MDPFEETSFSYLSDNIYVDFSKTDNDNRKENGSVSGSGSHSEGESETDSESDGDEFVEERDPCVDGRSDEFKNVLDITTEDIMRLEFSSEVAAYKFYFAYTKCHGFGIRKDEVRHDEKKNVIMRQFLCNKAGLRDKKHLMKDDRKRDHRPLTRTNCKAKLRVRLDRKTSNWKVVAFEESHNHDLCHANYVPLIRSYRGLTDADKAQVDSLHEHGVRTCQIMGYMMNQKGGHAGIGFNKKDLFNHIERQKCHKMKYVDVNAALSYLQGKADNDAMFFSRYLVGEDGKLCHLFWADGTSRTDFQCFGDVIAFDSTYKKNKYNKSLVIFSGKNNHSETVIFCCALVSNETTDAYKWVLRTFLDAMCNKEPTTVVTDGDGAMREEIKHVFPNACHRLCAWHLQKNACENVKNAEFLVDFKRAMYGNFTVECFEKYWKEMVARHDLEGNLWVSQTYEKRSMWATAYLREHLFAGIRTTSLCEGVNSVIKTYIRRKNTILELLHNFENFLRDYRYKELVSDFNTFYTEPVLTTPLPKIEQHVATLFTRNVFKLVRSEIMAAGSMNVVHRSEDADKVVLKVGRHCQRSRERQVVWDKIELKFQCDCRMNESCGVPCSHIICGMRHEHVDSFPNAMINKRWLKDGKSTFMQTYQSDNMDNNLMVMARFRVLTASCNRLSDIASKNRDSFNYIRKEILKLTNKVMLTPDMHVTETDDANGVFNPNVVKTKGTPQKKKNRRKTKCSSCNKSGHHVTTCPLVHSVACDFSLSPQSSGLRCDDNTTLQDKDKERPPVDEVNMPPPTDIQSSKHKEAVVVEKLVQKKFRSSDESQLKDKRKVKSLKSVCMTSKDLVPNSYTSINVLESVPPGANNVSLKDMDGGPQPHQTSTMRTNFPIVVASQGMFYPPVYGFVPYYPQYQPQFLTYPVAPDRNLIPMNSENYGTSGNITADSHWNNLLHSVINGGSGSGAKCAEREYEQ